MADAYRKIIRKEDSLPENEIRVRKDKGIGKYLQRAYELLNDKENPKDSVVIKGVANAIQSAVNLAELIKHRVKGLHQISKITNITIVDEFEPLFEGLDHLKFNREATMLEITLTKKVDEKDKRQIGYQAPISESEVQEYNTQQKTGGQRYKRNNDGNRGNKKPRYFSEDRNNDNKIRSKSERPRYPRNYDEDGNQRNDRQNQRNKDGVDGENQRGRGRGGIRGRGGNRGRGIRGGNGFANGENQFENRPNRGRNNSERPNTARVYNDNKTRGAPRGQRGGQNRENSGRNSKQQSQ